KIHLLYTLLKDSEEGKKGISELQFICERVEQLGLQTAKLEVDVTLARGLNYYTGSIFEVIAPTVAMGSIGGGGRYDDLTGIFGLKNMSGVGISFGLDRIYLVLEELGIFPETVTVKPKAIFVNYGTEEAMYAMSALMELRQNGIKAELYPDHNKIAKQFQYADKKGIPYVILAGSDEIHQNKFTLKELTTGEQNLVDLKELIQKLS
ncbi:MAG: His/Gly/Thr/Pro-type tRNA ligase C-terminal domain-containing protein, partial [Flavobacterium sp.]